MVPQAYNDQTFLLKQKHAEGHRYSHVVSFHHVSPHLNLVQLKLLVKMSTMSLPRYICRANILVGGAVVVVVVENGGGGGGALLWPTKAMASCTKH